MFVVDHGFRVGDKAKYSEEKLCFVGEITEDRSDSRRWAFCLKIDEVLKGDKAYRGIIIPILISGNCTLTHV